MLFDHTYLLRGIVLPRAFSAGLTASHGRVYSTLVEVSVLDHGLLANGSQDKKRLSNAGFTNVNLAQR